MKDILELIPQDAGSANRSGMLYAANEERFDSSHLSEPLVQFATGVIDKENLLELLDIIAPRVDAPRRFEYRKGDEKSDFLSEEDDVRAIGGTFKRVEARGTAVHAATLNKGLTVRLDKDGEGALPNATERAVARLTRRLFRNDLVRAISLLVSSANNTGKTWNTSSDPDVDLGALVNSSGDKRGINPNTVMVGYGAWSRRIAALAGSDKVGAQVKFVWKPEDLAGWLGVERVLRVDVRKQVSASAKEKILGSYAIAYYAEQGAGLDTASNIARFVTPLAGGDVNVYVEDRPKFVDVTVEHYSLVAAPNTLGIEKYTVS